jgi:arsenite methyltransferase
MSITIAPVSAPIASCCGTPAGAVSATVASAGPRYSLRPATPADLPAARALVESAGLPADGLADQFGASYTVAVDAAGRIVGVGGVEAHGPYGLLRSVAVDASWRGRGVGEAITRDSIAGAAGAGLAGVYALTTTAADYFPRFGFRRVIRGAVPEPVRASVEFSAACPESADVLHLDLTGAARMDAVRATVRANYAAAARRVAGGSASTCGTTCCGSGGSAPNPITSDLYDALTASELPEKAVLASLGCGNPAALAELNPGEVVLDLGSGGGIDVLLSARRVGPTGRAYGVDMTDEMLDLARSNAREAGVENVEFLKGHIEEIPLPDASVDVIISNCVINLSADKSRVFAEAFRVLKPGGRFAVSDVVARGDVPEAVRRSMELWVGCVAGALHEREFVRMLQHAGFIDAGVEPTRVYRVDDARGFLEEAGIDPDSVSELDGRFASAFVRATKPLEGRRGRGGG